MPEESSNMYVGFMIVGVGCFLVAAFLFLFVVSGSCCGVTIFSPQVSISEMLGFFLFPAIPAAAGSFMFWVAWKLYPRNGI